MTQWLDPVQVAPFPVALSDGAELRSALAGAVFRHDETNALLRTAVEACVRSLRTQGMSPEGTVITLKAFVRHTALGSPQPQRPRSVTAADFFMEDIVHWTILEYFREV